MTAASGMSRARALQLLGLTSEDPLPEEVRRAYKVEALKWHPDRPQNHGREGLAKSMFQDVKNAFDVLQSKTAQWDAQWFVFTGSNAEEVAEGDRYSDWQDADVPSDFSFDASEFSSAVSEFDEIDDEIDDEDVANSRLEDMPRERRENGVEHIGIMDAPRLSLRSNTSSDEGWSSLRSNVNNVSKRTQKESPAKPNTTIGDPTDEEVSYFFEGMCPSTTDAEHEQPVQDGPPRTLATGVYGEKGSTIQAVPFNGRLGRSKVDVFATASSGSSGSGVVVIDITKDVQTEAFASRQREPLTAARIGLKTRGKPKAKAEPVRQKRDAGRKANHAKTSERVQRHKAEGGMRRCKRGRATLEEQNRSKPSGSCTKRNTMKRGMAEEPVAKKAKVEQAKQHAALVKEAITSIYKELDAHEGGSGCPKAWTRRFGRELGTYKQFVQSQPTKLRVTTIGRSITVKRVRKPTGKAVKQTPQPLQPRRHRGNVKATPMKKLAATPMKKPAARR